MKYSEELKNKGFEIKFRKECEDGEGYDLYLTVNFIFISFIFF